MNKSLYKLYSISTYIIKYCSITAVIFCLLLEDAIKRQNRQRKVMRAACLDECMWQDVWHVTLMRCQRWAGIEDLLLVLPRIFIRYYGNVTLNYKDSMGRQDGMNYWCSAIFLFFPQMCRARCFLCTQPTFLHLIEIRERERVKERQSTAPDTDSSHVQVDFSSIIWKNVLIQQRNNSNPLCALLSAHDVSAGEHMKQQLSLIDQTQS